MRIQVLNPLLANQIAAGEVIERPASVVKELVENALDAKATQITVEVEQGGHDLIRVRDNGQGIHPQDLALALERHATSKIGSFEDLMSVQSLGFRGEALASIAAVSRLKISSKKASQDSGFFAQAEGGHYLEKCAPIPHPNGTTLEIRELFFNTPARKKFLRKPSTEFSHVEAIMLRLALSHFEVAFTLKHNDQIIFQAQATANKIQEEKRVAELMGSGFIAQSFRIEWEASGLRIHGWIGLPTYSRTQSDLQFFYINNRFVRDKLLMHAVRSAYQDVLFGGRHPAYVLFIDMDPAAVDVNVHPTKHEVRFRDQRSIHDGVRHAIQTALEQANPQKILENSSTSSSPQYHQQMDLVSSENLKPLIREQMALYSELKNPGPISEKSPAASLQEELPLTPSQPLGYALGQIHNTFIVAQNENGMILVDQHAAHERLLYEKLKLEMTQKQIAVQSLLIPIQIPLSREEFSVWENIKEDLMAIGLHSEAIGPQAILIRETPTVLKNKDLRQLIHDLFSDYRVQENSARVQNTMDELLGNIACKSAIKANHPMSLESINALLRQMERTPKSSCCNHGRPTWIQISASELDAFFMRGK